MKRQIAGIFLLLAVFLGVAFAAKFQSLTKTERVTARLTPVAFRINFFGRRYDQFWVDWERGLITFDGNALYDTDEVKSFPNPGYKPNSYQQAHKDTPLIAIYYTNAKKLLGANVTIVTPLSSVPNSQAVSQWCREVVAANIPEANGFQCDNFVLVSWIGSGPYGTFPGGVPRNNYQILLATSGEDTYAIFNYQDLSWHADKTNGGSDRAVIENVDSPDFPKVGFNMGGGRRFMSLPYSGRQEVISLADGDASASPQSWKQQEQPEGTDLPAPVANQHSIRGVYAYRISNKAEALVGSCHLGALSATASDQHRRLQIHPASGYFLGGQHVTIRGQCFDPSTDYDIRFETEPEITVPCKFVDKLTISCTLTDWFLRRGYIPFRLFENKLSTKFTGNFYATIVGAEVMMQNYAGMSGSLDVDQIPISWDQRRFAGSQSDHLVVSLYGYQEVEKIPVFDYLRDVGNTSSVDVSTFVIDTAKVRCKTPIDCKRMDSGVIAVEDPMTKRRIWSRPFQLGWLYTKLEEEPKTVSEICYMRYRERETKRTEEDWREAVPNCPCSQRQADADFRFTREDQFLGFGDSTRCYVSYPIRGSTGASQCCYRVDDTGLLVYSNDSAKPDAIDSPMMRAHYLGGFPFNQFGRVPIFSHLSTDAILKHTCCQWSQKTSPQSCSYYKEVRATKDCSVYRTPFMASAYGLSHFKTFRGTFYQFYGNGEYVLLKSNTDEIQIQGRFEQITNIETHEPAHATGITAIGAKIGCKYGSSKAYVEHSKTDPPTLYVYIDGVKQDHIDIRFGGKKDLKVTRNVVESHCITVVYDITETHDSSVSLFLADGAVVRIKAVQQVLNIDVQLPDNSKKYPTMPRYYGLFGELSEDSRQPGADLYDLDGNRIVEPNEVQLPHRIDNFAAKMLLRDRYESVMLMFNGAIQPSDYHNESLKLSPRQFSDNSHYNVLTEVPTEATQPAHHEETTTTTTTVAPVVQEQTTIVAPPQSPNGDLVAPEHLIKQAQQAQEQPLEPTTTPLAASPMNALVKRRRRDTFQPAYTETVEAYDRRLSGDYRLQASTKAADTAAMDYQRDLAEKQEIFCPYLNLPNAVKSTRDTRVGTQVKVESCNSGFAMMTLKPVVYTCRLQQSSKPTSASWDPQPSAHCTVVSSTGEVTQQGMSTAIIIGIAVGALVLISVIIAIFLIVRNKSSKKSKTAAAVGDVEESAPLNAEVKVAPSSDQHHHHHHDSRPTSGLGGPSSPTTSSPLSPTLTSSGQQQSSSFDNIIYQSPVTIQPPTAFPPQPAHTQHSPAPVAKFHEDAI